MEEIVKSARTAAMRKSNLDRLAGRLQATGRLDFGDISRRIVRDAEIRDWAIRQLVESGSATIEVDFSTGGRPRTTLVLKT